MFYEEILKSTRSVKLLSLETKYTYLVFFDAYLFKAFTTLKIKQDLKEEVVQKVEEK